MAENTLAKGTSMSRRLSYFYPLLPQFYFNQLSRVNWNQASKKSFQAYPFSPAFLVCLSSIPPSPQEGGEAHSKINYGDWCPTSPSQVPLPSYSRVPGTILYTEWTIYQLLTIAEQWMHGRRWHGGDESHFSIKNKIASPMQRWCSMCHLGGESFVSHQRALSLAQERVHRWPLTAAQRPAPELRIRVQK